MKTAYRTTNILIKNIETSEVIRARVRIRKEKDLASKRTDMAGRP